MGRPRKSAQEHLDAGTYRADRHGPLPASASPADPPRKPPGLAPTVAAKWDWVTSALAHMLRPHHGPLLVELCWWLAEADRLRAAVGAKKPGQKGYCMLLKAVATVTQSLLAFSQRLGLTPGDQAKLKVAVVAPTATKPKAGPPRTALDGTPPPEVAA